MISPLRSRSGGGTHRTAIAVAPPTSKVTFPGGAEGSKSNKNNQSLKFHVDILTIFVANDLLVWFLYYYYYSNEHLKYHPITSNK